LLNFSNVTDLLVNSEGVVITDYKSYKKMDRENVEKPALKK
jgi:hypothetical protein